MKLSHYIAIYSHCLIFLVPLIWSNKSPQTLSLIHTLLIQLDSIQYQDLYFPQGIQAFWKIHLCLRSIFKTEACTLQLICAGINRAMRHFQLPLIFLSIVHLWGATLKSGFWGFYNLKWSMGPHTSAQIQGHLLNLIRIAPASSLDFIPTWNQSDQWFSNLWLEF